MLEKQLKQVTRTMAAPSQALKEGGAEYKRATRFAVGGYMLCSSLLLICNKVAVHHLPAPGLVLFGQLFFTALACFVLSSLNCAAFTMTESIFEWQKVKPYLVVSAVFLSTVFANIKTLQYCNVETFIVFRASTPLVVSIGDYVFLGRELPTLRSWLTLIGLLVGAAAYAVTDSHYDVRGYTFVIVWYVVFSIDQLFIKHICNTVKVSSNWGRVYYTNLFACAPLIAVILYNGEVATLKTVDNSFYAAIAFSVAMFLGFFMGYFAFLARDLLSAASFTIVGNVCKVLTVLINFMIWDKHANTMGIVALFFCLFCAYNYEQAPKRAEYQAKESKSSSPRERGDTARKDKRRRRADVEQQRLLDMEADDEQSDNAAHTH